MGVDDNLVSRDPFKINRDLKVDMEYVIAEPDSIQSPRPVWLLNYYCYHFAKLLFYYILTIIVGPILSLVFGIVIGIISFIHIWIFMPLYKISKIFVGWAKRYVSVAVDATIIPCAHGFGHVYSGIRVQHGKVADDPENILLI